MSLTKLPSGSYRAQIYDRRTGKNVSVSKVLGLPAGTTWPDKRSAKIAREQARQILERKLEHGVTVLEFWERWTTDPVFRRPKESTNLHNLERTRLFVQAHGSERVAAIDHDVVARWIAGGKNRGTVPALRAMFNDAAGPLGPRLIGVNPFAKLGLERSRGRADMKPPSIEMAQRIVTAARNVSCPSFAGWLQLAQETGMRPGELDALKWEHVDFDEAIVRVLGQFNARTRTFTSTKNGLSRPVVLTDRGRDALDLPREGEFCFPALRASHWSAQSRAYHWKAVKAVADWNGSLYLATRHYAGWFMYEILGLEAADVAFQLGHTDGGILVQRLYGHRDRDRGLERVRAGYSAHESARAAVERARYAG
jgi:integrase